jgi:hypothetical protein
MYLMWGDMNLTYIFSGFAVGTLVGLTGVGGGSLMTPLLTLLFGVSPTVAVGTDLAFASITKATGTFTHRLRHRGMARCAPAVLRCLACSDPGYLRPQVFWRTEQRNWPVIRYSIAGSSIIDCDRFAIQKQDAGVAE